MSSPFTVATAVDVVTGARPSRPDVSASRNPPTKKMTRNIQMYFAELRIDCSTGLYSCRDKKKRLGCMGVYSRSTYRFYTRKSKPHIDFLRLTPLTRTRYLERSVPGEMRGRCNAEDH
jgi:hypothetical protein